ncbi:22.0 kDa heat shock protein-like [Cucumis melo var. makuwa]|uniref:22.0 kDa heat shock protein-like n=2 Tax=Cucumis melo TaxID=3656 RepID=A0A5A7SMA0_CUCMM|nr:22.0 kDa heat shock protein-like [Cucumis melo var. makuwa]
MAMMGLPRNSLFLILGLAFYFLAAQQVNALMPYRSIWDIMQPGGYSEDPFRILEQSPLSVPKSAVDTLAVARADWKETEKEHVIWMDIPGVKREDLKIEVEENRVLRISGEMKGEGEVEGERWHRAERMSSSGRFWRQFRMPGNADMEGIRAHLENGVLKVIVPKLPQEKKKEAKVVKIEEGAKSGGEDLKATKAEM